MGGVVYTWHIMFGKLKSFAAKKLVEQQIKKLPPQQQAAAREQMDLILALMEKDPQLFEQIAKEIEAEVKKGRSQQAAALAVLPKYQSQLQALMGDKMPKGQSPTISGFNPNGSIKE